MRAARKDFAKKSPATAGLWNSGAMTDQSFSEPLSTIGLPSSVTVLPGRNNTRP